MKPATELLQLTDKAAIVTGGAKGIGWGISYRLAEAGACVLIADIDTSAAREAAAELKAKGLRAESLSVDVASAYDVKGMIDACLDHFGGVDILVNNAGVYPNQPISQMEPADFERVMHVNLRSVYLTTKYASEVMVEAGAGGRIINITSIDAVHPSMVGLAHYDASKHGVWGFTKNSALELAPHGIWVNAIAPGGVNTPGVAVMQETHTPKAGIDQAALVESFLAGIPMRRMGEPDDIGKVALFLASDMASYITGTQIVVDGGVLLR